MIEFNEVDFIFNFVKILDLDHAAFTTHALCGGSDCRGFLEFAAVVR